MKEYIIDSSVAIKWLSREPGSTEAEKIIQEFTFFYAPGLFLIEMDSVITKKFATESWMHVKLRPRGNKSGSYPIKLLDMITLHLFHLN